MDDLATVGVWDVEEFELHVKATFNGLPPSEYYEDPPLQFRVFHLLQMQKNGGLNWRTRAHTVCSAALAALLLAL